MSDIKPIKVYTHGPGPNPKKVLIVLDELEIPYEAINIEDPKSESFEKLNPNGRLPAIEDPNTGLTLWESGAIVEYIIETYDKKHKLSYATSPEKYLLKQYLHFQMSGQGPYYGQLFWFQFFHKEDVPSAKERYTKEIVRVISVLDKILVGKEYLVGDKCTYADLVFTPWNNMVPMAKDAEGGNIYETFEIEKTYPHYWAWHHRLMERAVVKKHLTFTPPKHDK
ncbi:hypothetical protein G7046_g2424 [Stylonectria norvegica]|nr:hypothetical protein G7046_g2424 [Stylonectria norvegica]